MLLAAAVIFVYYTTWAILLVRHLTHTSFHLLTTCLSSLFLMLQVLSMDTFLPGNGRFVYQLLP